MHLRRELLTQGIKLLESRRITSSHHHNPWFAVDCGNADEDTGEVWFGVLAWMRGLDSDARYEVEGIADARSGSAWMQAGLSLDLDDFQSAVRRIRRV